MTNLSEIETKLLRLAFDPAAHQGEIDNAAERFFRILRKRGVTADQFINNGSSNNSSSNANYEALYHRVRMEASGLRIENASLMREKQDLLSRIAALSRSGSGSGTRTPRTAGLPKPYSAKLNFEKGQDGNWYATGRYNDQYGIGRKKGVIYLWIKTSYASRFKTEGTYQDVSDAVRRAESMG